MEDHQVLKLPTFTIQSGSIRRSMFVHFTCLAISFEEISKSRLHMSIANKITALLIT
jgi:hypothetical protein